MIQHLVGGESYCKGETVAQAKAFQLKGRLFTLTVLNVLSLDQTLLTQQLTQMAAEAPKLFEYTPVVVDVSAIGAMQATDLQILCDTLRDHGLVPIGIQGHNKALEADAKDIGLALLNASKLQDKPWQAPATEKRKPKAQAHQTKIHTSAVRSGQQIANPTGDLIVMASVSHGAELLAAGNIHVYGKLRGRALAGITGNKHARVFCQSLDPELLSIAGMYRLREAIEPSTAPQQVFIQDDRIQIEPL